MEHIHLEALYPETSRHWELEQILSFVKRGESCEMIAFPGVGRGNVCKFLCYNRAIRIKHLGKKQTEYHFVFINFAEVKNRYLFDVTKFIFLQLTTSLHERLFKEEFTFVDKLFKKYLAYKDDLVLFEGLKQAIDYLVHEKGIHVILLLERFELYLPRLSETFFINLRALRDTAKYKFSVVFSTTRPLEDVVEHGVLADFYEFFAGRHVYLQLCDKPGITFRIEYLEKIVGKVIDINIKKELLKLTGGHGKLTRLGMETLLAGKSSQLTVHSSRFKEVSTMNHEPKTMNQLSSFLLSQKTIQQALKEIWEFLTPEETDVILRLQPKNPLMTEQEILRYAQDDKNKFLENVGLIKNNRLTIPLFEEWIQIKNLAGVPPSGTMAGKQEPIAYDAETNAIKRGDTVISDLLTASEFRLLRYLLENPNKVLEREHIINAVWKDNATTLGVTDQAFDQLLFRLRKKIEQNPNKPTIIETVKGRGVRYNKI